MRQRGVQTLAASGVESVAPVSATTVYSDKIEDFENVVKIGLELIATGTTPDVLVKLAVSQDDSNYAVEDSYSDIMNITDTSRHRKTIHDTSIPAAKYAKIMFVGQGSNGANVAVTGKLNILREID